MITPKQAENTRTIHNTKIRKMRVKKGISQNELSNLSGVPIKTLQGYEQCTLNIDGAKLNTLCNLCIALGCKIGDILEDAKLTEKYNIVK